MKCWYFVILLYWRINILMDRLSYSIEQRYSGPIRGMIDSAVDSGMIIIASSEIIILSNTPTYASSPQAIADFNYFAYLFYNFTKEDNIPPEFQLPIPNHKCALVRVHIPEFYDYVSFPFKNNEFHTDNTKWSVTIRGISRQIKKGECMNSPIVYNAEYSTLLINDININKGVLYSMTKHISFYMDPILYVSLYIKDMFHYPPFTSFIEILFLLQTFIPTSFIPTPISLLTSFLNK